MRNPNSFGDIVGNDSEKNNEARSIDQERGNSTLRGAELAKRREELLKKNEFHK